MEQEVEADEVGTTLGKASTETAEMALTAAPLHVAEQTKRDELTTRYYQGYMYVCTWASSKTWFIDALDIDADVVLCWDVSWELWVTLECGCTCVATWRSKWCLLIADRLAIEHMEWPVRQVSESLRREYYDEDNHNAVHGLSEEQVVDRTHSARNEHYSGDFHATVEIPPLLLVLNGSPTVPMSTGRNDFLDDTFLCVHRNCKQCVFIMVRNRATGVFVLVFYILSTLRTTHVYWDMLHFVFQTTKQQN
ncbi:hypothetical protein PHMEG_00027872 [Phytophthora megakarya]|uniref:Uncharacterized protein n=1 Tax=Phytophthora megakarya TaxID=4795 RepID=A0A225V7W2_9STRA|nr:hypothetical protein PHMEG_00027872 [Phytophthora megakarya]